MSKSIWMIRIKKKSKLIKFDLVFFCSVAKIVQSSILSRSTDRFFDCTACFVVHGGSNVYASRSNNAVSLESY